MEIYAAKNDSVFLTKRHYEDRCYNYNIINRDPFQRDRDRIIHSRAFRRMMHKTQVFNANKGDHFRNRLTHTLEVSQIARSIGKYLKLNDELIEAIALGHDLGHTPFGHIGERTLNTILMEGLDNEIPPIKQNFKHNFQSLRVVDKLETRCADYLGINLTFATREGILKHTKVRNKYGYYHYLDLDLTDMHLDLPFSITLEGQVVAIADEIAQCTHDLEDGVRSGVINFKSLMNQPLVSQCMEAYHIAVDKGTAAPAYETRSLIIKNLVGYLIYDVCKQSEENISQYIKKYDIQNEVIFKKQRVSFSNAIDQLVKELKNWMDDRIIYSEEVSISDAKAQYLIKQLFKAFYVHPKQLPDYMLGKYFKLKGRSFNRAGMNDAELKKDAMFIRMVADHIGGMTDQFASRTYKKLYYPDYI
ncbi:dGTP triphosphohydrolase [Megasphaera elsdenii]|jgi:dGTPase|uniref:dGTP triphosphohydrolase n=1 Tax=Megasphaera elsdenii TaxID=907 RepID=UPI002670967A|nr:dNTP triphosphohydrolase [Megasphaera elsdenii]